MTAKRVASAKKAKERDALERKLRKARGMTANLLNEAEQHPEEVERTTAAEWCEVFTQLLKLME
jgi:hypothetical protein